MRSLEDWIAARLETRCPAGCNRHSVSVGPLDIFFSYRTVVGIRGPSDGCSRDWISMTTSKHQSELGSPGPRVGPEEFNARLALALVDSAKELLKELAPFLPKARSVVKKATGERTEAAARRTEKERRSLARKAAKEAREREAAERAASESLF